MKIQLQTDFLQKQTILESELTKQHSVIKHLQLKLKD
jgi:hypothetical protein